MNNNSNSPKDHISVHKDLLKAALADDEYYDLIAASAKKMYDALIDAKFPERDARMIVANQDFGMSIAM